MKVSVHVGAHKTASTHFQKSLRRQARAFRQGGTALFLPRELRRGDIPMQKLARGVLGKTPGAINATRAAFRDVTAEAEHVLLSDENLIGSAHSVEMRQKGRLYPKGHLRLQRFLSGMGIERATVYLAIRDPACFIVSAYGQSVTSRGYMPFRQFLGGLDVCTLFWSEFVERLAGCPEVAKVVVWRYEDYPEIAPDVLRHMLPAELAGAVDLGAEVTHSGMSDAALARIEAEVTEGAVLSSADIRAIRTELPKGENAPGFMPFEKALLRESSLYYAEDLADIAALPGVTVLR